MATIDKNQKLAEIKSSIELLEECKQKVLANDKLDEKTKKDRTEQIDEAIKENYDKARLQFQATKKEVDGMIYNEVSEEYKAKYAKRLEAKGLTDEQLHQKEQAVAIVATGDEEGKVRKRHRRTKRTEQRDDESGFDPTDIKRLENEEELMNKTLAKDKKDLERRRHHTTDTMSDKPKETKEEAVIGTIIESKKIKPREEVTSVVTVEGEKETKRQSERVLDKSEEENSNYDFDVTQIPSYIQYDILPLPSNGECYSHKKNRIPVAYLTAADENIIASPNMYRDGKVIDTILERKILDKDIKVEDLCKGDKDAIILWLRATGYGPDFPIVTVNPNTQKKYPITVKLDTFKYLPFNLKGDKNGYFEYKANNGDLIKFKYFSVKDEEEIKNDIIARITSIEKYNALKYLNNFKYCLNKLNLNEGDIKEIEDCIADINDIINFENLDLSQNEEDAFSYGITSQMIQYTISVNGNDDREYIKNYIENMRSKDALDYRRYVNDNTPGVNMKIKVNVPQSDGGGTFDTFLRLDDYVFANI